ncbi:MAG TPA: asparagine synthase-related protein, partial [Longimicrobiales bacterium]|nr:asparagine synthase-related protein [Longimicrobiales bacterium]
AAPRTVFESVRELPPGHRLVLDERGVTVDSYWTWTYPLDGSYAEGPERELAEELRALLSDATRIRLRADVPVGAYLSGGLDSSALVTLMHEHEEAQIRTFSIGFESEEFDESEHQRLLIEHLGVCHARAQCDNAAIGEALFDTIRHTEMPILRTAPVPMRLLSGEVRRQQYKVVLTGEGADEVLGGYDIFKEAKIRRFWSHQPRSEWRPTLLRRLYPWLSTGAKSLPYLRSFYGVGLDDPEQALFSHLPRFLNTSQCKQFFSSGLRDHLNGHAEEDFEALIPAAARTWHAFNRGQQLEARTLMSGYLLSAQGDRMLMSNSVEGRFPFLDHRVMEFAARLDPRLKMKVLDEKYLLKQAMRADLPRPILERHKQPYRAPDSPAIFAGRNLPWVDELLSESVIRDYGYFDEARVAMLTAKARSGRATAFRDNMALIGILTTQLWHHHFVERFRDWRPGPGR